MICQSYRIYKGNRYCPNHIGFTKEIVLSQPYRNYKGNRYHYDDIGYLKEISIARLLFYYTKQSSTENCVHTVEHRELRISGVCKHFKEAKQIY